MSTRTLSTAFALIVAVEFFPAPARAHGSAAPVDLSAGALISATILLSAALAYGWAFAFSGTRAGRWRWRRAGAFIAGLIVFAIALVWPVDRLAEESFAAHMAQHMVLMTIAAPLVVLSQPLVPLIPALPTSLGRTLATLAAALSPRRDRRFPIVVATVLQAVVLWAWHAPAVFLAAQRSEVIHLMQHASMVGVAIWFWWSLLRAGRKQAAPATAVLCALATLVHTGMLGGLLTFARKPLYARPLLDDTVYFWSTEDQQLAGLIMWVPAGVAYLTAGLILASQMLNVPGFGAKGTSLRQH
jgi:putative membrane protein